MLDAFRNISILNHFLQNVTCSMWVILKKTTNLVFLGGSLPIFGTIKRCCSSTTPLNSIAFDVRIFCTSWFQVPPV